MRSTGGRRVPDVGIEVSVVVPTRDRAGALRAHLGAVVAAVGALGDRGELIVVDNGSRDDTAAAVHETAPSARLVRATDCGASRARNAGVAEARGRVVLFTDDDVEPPLDWAARLSAPLLDGSADVVAGGVRVDESRRLAWASPWLLRQFADHPDPGGDGAFVVGASFGATVETLRELPFDEHLGRPPYAREEDAFFWIQARERGLRIRGVGGAPAVHHFDPARLETPALLELARTMGRCRAYIWHHWLHGRAPLLALKEAWYGLDLALRRVPAGEHPTDAEMERVARREFIRELRRLRGTERNYPPPAERRATPPTS